MKAMCGVQLKDGKKSCGFDVESKCQLAMANSVRWYGHVLRREGGHILSRALDFEVEGQGEKWRPMRTWKKQVEEESVNVALTMQYALCRSKWSDGVCYWASPQGESGHPHLSGIRPDFKEWFLFLNFLRCSRLRSV